MNWLDRAVNMESIVQAKNAPAEVQIKASDAIQAFIYAQECRKSANVGSIGFGAKADQQHRRGKKLFSEVKTWLDANSNAVMPV